MVFFFYFFGLLKIAVKCEKNRITEYLVVIHLIREYNISI